MLFLRWSEKKPNRLKTRLNQFTDHPSLSHLYSLTQDVILITLAATSSPALLPPSIRAHSNYKPSTHPPRRQSPRTFFLGSRSTHFSSWLSAAFSFSQLIFQVHFEMKYFRTWYLEGLVPRLPQLPGLVPRRTCRYPTWRGPARTSCMHWLDKL